MASSASFSAASLVEAKSGRRSFAPAGLPSRGAKIDFKKQWETFQVEQQPEWPNQQAYYKVINHWYTESEKFADLNGAAMAGDYDVNADGTTIAKMWILE